MNSSRLLVAGGEWVRAAQVSFFKPVKGSFWCGAVQHPQTQKWQSWARLYASDLTCLSVHSGREEAEQAILGFGQALKTGKLVNTQARAVFIHNFELQGLGHPEPLEPRQIDFIWQWIKRQWNEKENEKEDQPQPFYIYAFAGKGRGSKTYRWRQIAGPFKGREEAWQRLNEFHQLPRPAELSRISSVTAPPAGIAAYIVEPVCEKFLNLNKKDPAVKAFLSQESG